jgi:hypothetical protein
LAPYPDIRIPLECESKRKKRASLKIIVENTTGGAWVPGSFT